MYNKASTTSQEFPNMVEKAGFASVFSDHQSMAGYDVSLPADRSKKISTLNSGFAMLSTISQPLIPPETA
jgi:hypothetical protein